ncbi:MAG: HAD family hydrolase [Dehalococcoidia bacterium]|nr:HAD family hydrolase [Dehalococcoidia bacterium]
MLRAVLFDLDNTLIHIGERQFFQVYIPAVARAFADVMPEHLFLERLLSSTGMVLKNDGSMLNVDCFMNAFCKGYEAHRQDFWQRFVTFYETEYDRFRSLASVPPGVRDLLLELRETSLKVVIASNPLWPSIAQKKRLAWAGLGDLEFDLITHIENMTYCKPRVEYYRETCAKIGESPEACLMVGNDPVNDMVVGTIGMKTYLVTDSDPAGLEVSRTTYTTAPPGIPKPDFEGPLQDVPVAVRALMGD